MIIMKSRINRDMTREEFDEHYFLKEELVDFCRNEGLKVSGNKADLEERIRYYLDSGEKLDNTKRMLRNRHENICPTTLIGENFTCSQQVRAFFEEEIGSSFKFKVAFQKWLKGNPDKTFADAIDAYRDIVSDRSKTGIGKQFQYNQYIRDFFNSNPDKSFKDAVECWNNKKKLRGSCKYDDSDLQFLKKK